MSGVQVWVDGVPLESMAAVSDVVDSTVYRTKTFDNDPGGFSGDFTASCKVALRGDSAWPRVGDTYEHREHGKRTWGGSVSEITPDDADGGGVGVTIAARGFGALLANWQALEADASPAAGFLHVKTSTQADAAVDYAHTTRDLPVFRGTNALRGSNVAGPGANAFTLAQLMDLTSKAAGTRWYVDSFGEISMVTDATTPAWMLTPGAAYLGTPDDQYVTHLYGYAVAHVSTDGTPDAWGWVVHGDDEMATQNQRREAKVDLTALGLLGAGDAQANIDGRFALVGARMGWTNTVTLTPTNLFSISGGFCSPMALWGAKGAGSMLTLPGSADSRSTTTTRSSVRFLIGQLDRNHTDQTAVATPLGFVPRDFEGAMAAAQAPADDSTSGT